MPAFNPALTPDSPNARVPERQVGSTLRRNAGPSSATTFFKASLTMGHEQVQSLPCPLRQVQDRPRFGYPGYADRQPTIDDVVPPGSPPNGGVGNQWDIHGAGRNSGTPRNVLMPNF